MDLAMFTVPRIHPNELLVDGPRDGEGVRTRGITSRSRLGGLIEVEQTAAGETCELAPAPLISYARTAAPCTAKTHATLTNTLLDTP